MPTAVCNSDLLTHLAAIGQFNLLRDYYDEIRVPPAVWREVVDGSRSGGVARAVNKAAREGWLRVVAPNDGALISLNRDLGESDAEAIALAVQEKPDAVLLGEGGVIGLLIQAKQEGRFVSIEALLSRLWDEAGPSLDHPLSRAALQAVDEA